MGRDAGGKHRKPRGISGWLSLVNGELKFQSTDLPCSKAEIELHFANKVVQSGAFALGVVPWPDQPVQEEENSFDFRFPGAKHTYLEAMEITYFDGPGGFDRVPMSRNAYEFTKRQWNSVASKAQRYVQRKKRSRVHLLLYATETLFALDPSLNTALAYVFFDRKHPILSVTYVDNFKEPSVLFPRPAEEFEGYDLNELRRFEMISADLSSIRQVGPREGVVDRRAHRGDPAEESRS
jgi:hypothetical protein